MKISSISDIHIIERGDLGHQLLDQFLKSDEVRDSSIVIFLGDIFDVLVGKNTLYLERYDFFFNAVNELLSQKEVVFINGNHDFHIRSLFENSIPAQLLSKFKYIETYHEIESAGKRLVFSHGDEEEIENEKHKLFKRFVNSRFSRWIAEQERLTHFIDILAMKLSKMSKNKNKKYLDDSPEIREKFRRTSELFYRERKFDFWICGHSHCNDHYVSESGFQYLNNGFVQKTSLFFHFDGKAAQLKKLTTSVGEF